MVIALFTDTYPPFINGVSTSCYNLTHSLRAHGHRVIVVTARSSAGKLEFKDDIIYMPGIEMKKFYGYRLTRLFDKNVCRILKECGVELIHNQTDYTVGIFARRAAKKLKLPIVYTYHTSYEDYTYYATHGVLDRVAKKVVRSYSKGIATKATEFITPSTKTKDFMRSVGSDVYISVIPTGIDFSLFSYDKYDVERGEAFKKEHGIDKDTKVFLLLGRIASEKSMDVSIKYFARYVETHPHQKVKMIVVGDGPQRSELELLTHELHIASLVDFIGFVSAQEVPFYYHICDIYNSASITETQGLTFMEGMAAGAMVLARFDDNLTNTIIDGETGFFFTDEVSYINKVEKILSLTEEERQKIYENALKVIDLYSMDKFYSNIVEVYERALRKWW
ncbi:MAG: glycosyltransferase [Bacilli bacterium]|nr:glycosyltransferase [Bacilli bacterium]